jgi:hypothetical protein
MSIKKMSIKNMSFTKTLEPTLKLKKKIILGQDIKYTIDAQENIKKRYSWLDSIDDLLEITKKNENLYELITINQPVRIYLDLEIEREMAEEDRQEILKIFLDLFKNQFFSIFQQSINDQDIIILNSSKKDKLSYHIVFLKYYFDDCYILKSFIDYIINHLLIDDEKYSRLYWTKNEKEKFIMDTAPYGKNRLFRLVNQSKIGSNIKLKIISNHQPIDSFIGVYNITENDILLNFDKDAQSEAIKEKKIKEHTVKESKIKNLTEDNWADNKNTLIEFFKMSYDDLQGLPKWKQYLYLIPNNNVNYQNWLIIGYAIRYCGGLKEDWINWSKLSKSYKLGECDNFQKFHTAEGQGFGEIKNCYNIYTLRRFAKIAHPDFFKEKKQLFDCLFDMDLQNINVIEEKSFFLSQEGTSDSNNILNDDKMNILYAFLGKGKTTAIKRLIKEKNYDKILCLSPRQAFATFLSNDFNIDCYLDGDYSSNKLVIQVESLYKINIDTNYELIVIDESESILNQFSSDTMNGSYLQNFNTLVEVIKRSNKVIFADAFISNRTINFCKSFEEKITMIKNNTEPTERQAVEIDKKDFNSYLVEDLQAKNKNYICFSSKTDLIKFKSILKCDKQLGLKDFDKKALYYYGKGDDKVFETLKNINEEWTNASIVCTSPSITVGNSYSVKDHFNKVFINASPTCNVRDTFQSQMRVRYLKNNELIFCLPSKQQYTANKNKNILYFDVLDMFDEFQEDKKELIFNLIDNIKSDKTEELKERVKNLQETPKALKEILFFNLLEQGISQTYYNDLFKLYLVKCGYNISDDTTKINKLEDFGDGSVNYHDIKKITQEGADYIEDLEKRKKATEKEKLEKDRFYFDLIVKEEEERKHIYFKDFYMNGVKRNFFNNARLEFLDNVEETLKQDFIKSGGVIEVNNLKGVQLKYIQDINKILGLKNSFDDSLVNIEKINNLVGYFQENKKNINDAFKMRDRSKSDKMDLRVIIPLLNKIFKQWNNTEFQSARQTESKDKTKNLIESYKKVCMKPIKEADRETDPTTGEKIGPKEKDDEEGLNLINIFKSKETPKPIEFLTGY